MAPATTEKSTETFKTNKSKIKKNNTLTKGIGKENNDKRSKVFRRKRKEKSEKG